MEISPFAIASLAKIDLKTVYQKVPALYRIYIVKLLLLSFQHKIYPTEW